MYSAYPRAILLLLLLSAVAHSAVIVSTSASCGSPPASPIATNDAGSDPSNATAISDLDCIFGGENTGFSTAASTGSISGSTHVDLAVTGLASADTDFMLVPGRESAFQSAQSNLTVALDLLVTGGTPTGVLAIAASQCEMLAGVFGEFRVNGAPGQSLTGCGAGTEVFAPYTRNVPFQISWFIHGEAFSTMTGQADDVGFFTFDSFELLTPTSDPNPGASLVLSNIPEPSSFWNLLAGVLSLVAAGVYRTWRTRQCADPTASLQ
jgi:hypothetical protein